MDFVRVWGKENRVLGMYICDGFEEYFRVCVVLGYVKCCVGGFGVLCEAAELAHSGADGGDWVWVDGKGV